MQIRPTLNTTFASIGAALALIVGAAAMALPSAAGTVMPKAATISRVAAEVTDGGVNREGGSDPVQSRNAARSRMRECGHQWSAMKKNGTAAGLTWKDFSQGCLAKQ